MLWDAVFDGSSADDILLSAVFECLSGDYPDRFDLDRAMSDTPLCRPGNDDPKSMRKNMEHCGLYHRYYRHGFYWTAIESEEALNLLHEQFLYPATAFSGGMDSAIKGDDIRPSNDDIRKCQYSLDRIPSRATFDAFVQTYNEQSVIHDLTDIYRKRYNEYPNAEELRDTRAMITRFFQFAGFPYQPTHEDYIRFILKTHGEMIFKNHKNGTFKRIPTQKFLGLFTVAPIKPADFHETATYIVGRTGSGKSELIKTIFHHLRTLGGTLLKRPSLVVIDPHGELAQDLGRFGVTVAPHLARFVVNPFDIDDKSDDNRELVAQEITDLIANLVDDSGLSRLMNTVSFPIITTLLKLPYADFKMFADCINPNGGAERLKAMRHLVDPHLREVWQNLENDTYDTSKQSVFNRLQSFLNKKLIVQTLCGHDDFNAVMDEVEQGEPLIISIPSPAIGDDVSETLGKFFMTRMQIWAKRRQRIPENERKPVFLFVDEFQNFLSPSTARTLDQFGRKFKLFMILAHQHIGQIDDREIRGSIMANCKNKIAGISDRTTRIAVAHEMGSIVTPEKLEALEQGNWWGRFKEKEAFKFYARRANFAHGEIRFYPSKNAPDEYMDGWATLTPTKTQNAPHSPVITPKFDI